MSAGRVFVIGIVEGRFVVTKGTVQEDEVSCDLKTEELAKLLFDASFDIERDLVLVSSSVDFPEEQGAWKTFEGRWVVETAQVLAMHMAAWGEVERKKKL